MTAQQTHALDLTIRRLGSADAAAVRRLGELEGRDAPHGPLLGAFLGSRLMAVVAAAGGETLADPFVASSEALALLELRAKQMRGEADASRLGGLLRGLRRLGRARSHGTLAGSPPGGDGRLLQL